MLPITSGPQTADSSVTRVRGQPDRLEMVLAFFYVGRRTRRCLFLCVAFFSIAPMVWWHAVTLRGDGLQPRSLEIESQGKTGRETDGQAAPSVVQRENQNETTRQPPRKLYSIVENLISNDPTVPLTSRPTVAHVTWCGKRLFKFEHYLSLLSVVRVVKPLKVLFHSETPPVADGSLYHMWFEDALKQFWFIETRELPPGACKNTTSLFHTVTSLLTQTNSAASAYVGDSTLITRFTPFTEPTPEVTWYSHDDNVTSSLPDVIVTHKPLQEDRQVKEALKSSARRACVAVTRGSFARRDLLRPGVGCVVLQDSFIPEDFMELDTDFGAYVRWLYYGSPDLKVARPHPTWVVPRIAHYVWLQQRELDLSHFLSVLSAVHVARFDRVFFHADLQPAGKYWDLLAAHANVTLIRIQPPDTVFQQRVGRWAHKSDLLRLQILLQYGGVYSDRDAFWVRQPDDELMTYDSVACFDWMEQGWPRTFNLGVLVARRGARFVQQLQQTLRDYKDSHWGYNAIMVPYRVFQQSPDSLHVHPHLQVICFNDICHPAWEPTFQRPLHSQQKTREFDWRSDTYAVHVTWPKPPRSFQSPDALKNGTDIMADIGRHILKQAGMIIEDILH